MDKPDDHEEFVDKYISQESRLDSDTEESKKREDIVSQVSPKRDSDSIGEDSGGYDEDDEGDAADDESDNDDDGSDHDQRQRTNTKDYEEDDEISDDDSIIEVNRRRRNTDLDDVEYGTEQEEPEVIIILTKFRSYVMRLSFSLSETRTQELLQGYY